MSQIDQNSINDLYSFLAQLIGIGLALAVVGALAGGLAGWAYIATLVDYSTWLVVAVCAVLGAVLGVGAGYLGLQLWGAAG